jgi:LmbE family N-acetylglucosaminyl deacetylase
MPSSTDNFGRVLVLSAHPDDETLACSGLLQRSSESLVLFAVDGAPRHYGFERKFGSLQAYSEERLREASRALACVAGCSFARLLRNDGTPFPDQHLFLELRDAFESLHRATREFSPNLLVSHAFEGGHVDHDACHILARYTAHALSLPHLEFPLYWRDPQGRDVFQSFRNARNDEIVLQLTPQELVVKHRMLSEYGSQRNLTSAFHSTTERFRPMTENDCEHPSWGGYPFENRWRRLKTEVVIRKIAELRSLSPFLDRNTAVPRPTADLLSPKRLDDA